MKIKFLLIICSFGFGIYIDRFFIDFPYLELDSRVGVIDIASLIVGVVIAFLIPFSVHKIIEDKKGIKILIVDEIKELIDIVSKVRKILCDSHQSSTFTPKDRESILYVFHESDLKVISICKQVQEAFKKKSDEVEKTLKDLLFTYDKYITGGELMHESFDKVDERYFKESNTEYSKIETGFKTLLQKIYRF